MNSENAAAIRAAVEHAMSTLSVEEVRELVLEPYMDLRTSTVLAHAA